MENELSLNPAPQARATATWVGLGISLFSMLAIRQVFMLFTSPENQQAIVLREAVFWAAAAGLLWLVKKGEGLPLSSIGLGTSPLWKSALWGLAMAAASFAVALPIVHMSGYGHGAAAQRMDRLPLWLVTAIVVRAGVVEELFYRGFAIERLRALGLGKFMAVAIPLAIFGLGHWTGGGANILIALAVGAVLSGFYLWRRDLTANIFAHFLVDFIGNVLPRLLG